MSSKFSEGTVIRRHLIITCSTVILSIEDRGLRKLHCYCMDLRLFIRTVCTWIGGIMRRMIWIKFMDLKGNVGRSTSLYPFPFLLKQFASHDSSRLHIILYPFLHLFYIHNIIVFSWLHPILHNTNPILDTTTELSKCSPKHSPPSPSQP